MYLMRSKQREKIKNRNENKHQNIEKTDQKKVIRPYMDLWESRTTTFYLKFIDTDGLIDVCNVYKTRSRFGRKKSKRFHENNNNTEHTQETNEIFRLNVILSLEK